MLRMGGRVADGVRLHSFCTRRYIEDVCMARIGEGLARSGRKRADIEIFGGGFIATGVDEAAVVEMIDWVRYRVAFYGSTRTYLPVFSLHGLDDLGLKLHRMSVDGKWDQMAAEVSDDVVRLFAAVGTYAEIAGAIEARYGGAVDTIRLNLPTETNPGLAREVAQDIQRIPIAFEGFASG
jgi:alkanesulfonate monooxygenase SsuD/methylene tetrahydromethanopterin reductase-like flavin-dependent oxidoreductase (luciferase family)